VNIKYTLSLILCLYLSVFPSYATDLSNQDIFRGIVKQSHDNSCGSAALSNLINGMNDDVHFSEGDVIQAIKQVAKQDIAEMGYTLLDLQMAAKKLGYQAEWRKVSKANLAKIKQPVIIVIHLNTDFPHYVVLKGIRDNQAFLADSARGHVRINYDELVEKSLNEQHPLWFVMGINIPKNKPKNSPLYLSNDANERQASHITFAQGNALNLTTITKANQFIVSYDFESAFIKQDNQMHSRQLLNNVNLRYGLTDDIQIAGGFSYIDNRLNTPNKTSNSESKTYLFAVKKRFTLDNNEQNNIVTQFRTAYDSEMNTFSKSLGGIFYHNTDTAQFFLGSSINKDFLSKSSTSLLIGANKPIGDNYLAFTNLLVDKYMSKNKEPEEKDLYLISVGFSYVLNLHFQLVPSFAYSFGRNKSLSFGLSIAYLGHIGNL